MQPKLGIESARMEIKSTKTDLSDSARISPKICEVRASKTGGSSQDDEFIAKKSWEYPLFRIASFTHQSCRPDFAIFKETITCRQKIG